MIDNQITTWSVGLWSNPDITVSRSIYGMSLKNFGAVMMVMMMMMRRMMMTMVKS